MTVSLLVAIIWTNLIKSQWERYDQLLTTQILLSAQERSHAYTMTDHAEDSRFDPRVAQSLAIEAERFAERTSAPTPRIVRHAASLPIPAAIPPGTTVIVHEASERLPAIHAEISVVDQILRSENEIEVLHVFTQFALHYKSDLAPPILST